MRKYTISCVDRESGKDSIEYIWADNESAAFEQVADKGKLVSKVVDVVEYTSKPTSAVVPIVVLILGICAVLYGLLYMNQSTYMNTSYGTTHNIGLLNLQSITMNYGCAFFVGGAVMVAAGMIGCFIHVASRSICIQLSK